MLFNQTVAVCIYLESVLCFVTVGSSLNNKHYLFALILLSIIVFIVICELNVIGK